MAIAMRSPDVAPVFQGFNYDAHNYINLQIQQFPNLCRPTYQISGKLNTQRRIYCDLNISNLGTVRHLVFDRKCMSRAHNAPANQISAKSTNRWPSY